MKNKILPIIAAIIVIMAICMVVFIPKDKEENNKESDNVITTTTKTTTQAKTIDARINDNGDVEISVDDLDTSNATFINYTSNGINMELVAIKDNNGNIDIAFNTCQVCNGSPRAYFIQKNGKLVCQNCGNSFSLSSIGALAYGCNPMTIEDSNVTKIENGIVISKEYLSQNEKLFVNVASH